MGVTMETCPDCGNKGHNPKTGFCWKSNKVHCGPCCETFVAEPYDKTSGE